MKHAHTTLPTTNPDYLKVTQWVATIAGQTNEVGTTPSGNATVEEAIRQIEEFGVSFDGHQYWYQQYGYDQLADALNYALLDRASAPHGAKCGDRMEWLPAERPTADDQRLMDELAITFDGHGYNYAGYRYDHLADAASYAQLKH